MLNKNNNPLQALQFFFKGLTWLGRAKLRRFLLIPILINLLIYSGVLVLAYLHLNDLINYLIPAWLHWLSWLLWPLFFICLVAAGIFSFSILANLIAAPFYGRLSAKTLELIIQNKPEQTEEEQEESAEFDLTEPNWLKVMSGELRRIGYLLKWMFLLIIISFIPGLNLISPLLWAIFGAWGCALEFFAYPLENKGLLFPAQKSVVANVRLGALSFGGVVLIGLGLPFFNLLVAPAAVIGATFYVYSMDQAAKQQTPRK